MVTSGDIITSCMGSNDDLLANAFTESYKRPKVVTSLEHMAYMLQLEEC